MGSPAGLLVNVPIHSSCNGTQRAQIQKGLEDMRLLARASVERIHAFGPIDPIFVRYFGAEADPAPVIGYLEEILHGDKSGTVLRCDDPDGNCKLAGWAGHWRGDNATQETVICEHSYHTRRPLEQICGFGYQIARDSAAIYWGADLLHRLFHVPKVVSGKISHVADGFAEVLELARSNASAAVSNQESIQLFALDAYSRTVVPEGCLGKPAAEDRALDIEATGAAPPAQDEGLDPAPEPESPSSAEFPAADCHTHADGSAHCGAH
ncbi:uncharacterized protein PFL1_06362 [Pseudozyma flocculosa PF-1]|nr:uncharacterized protein PFL1_06362 [Pseudozyma flocculosa PF-1]EPQ26154.1 hypothetical protein PFL1_06362 [Pseudozyma flocculosa PF-1]